MARRKSTTASAPETAAPAPESTENTKSEPDTTLTGRLCADPVLRHTGSGKSVSTIRIAVNPPEGDASFHDVVVWGRTAEAVCQYKKRGHLVEVTGRAQTRDWTDRDGNTRQSSEISAYRVKFLNGQRSPQAEKEIS